MCVYVCMFGTHLCDPAHLPFVGGAVAGPRQGALLHGASPVQGGEGGSTQVEGVVGVVVQLVGVGQTFLTRCQDLACLKEKGEAASQIASVSGKGSVKRVLDAVVMITRPDLLRHIGFGSELEQAACEPRGRLKVFQFEEEIKCCA